MEFTHDEQVEEQVAVIDLDRAELLFILRDAQEARRPARRGLDKDDPRPSAQR